MIIIAFNSLPSILLPPLLAPTPPSVNASVFCTHALITISRCLLLQEGRYLFWNHFHQSLAPLPPNLAFSIMLLFNSQNKITRQEACNITIRVQRTHHFFLFTFRSLTRLASWNCKWEWMKKRVKNRMMGEIKKSRSQIGIDNNCHPPPLFLLLYSSPKTPIAIAFALHFALPHKECMKNKQGEINIFFSRLRYCTPTIDNNNNNK